MSVKTCNYSPDDHCIQSYYPSKVGLRRRAGMQRGLCQMIERLTLPPLIREFGRN